MSRVAKSIKITSRDIKKLKSIVGNPENTKEAANRCKAILLAGEGKQNKEIAAALHVRENSVGEWRKAWNDRGIEGILSIARTGRPKGQARIQLESQAGNSETTREKLLELAGKANASRSTLQRAMNAAGARYSESELIDLRMATQPKMLDVMGLYVSSNEAAVILRTAPPGQRLFGGKLYAHSPAVQSLLGEAGASEGDSDASIELGKALELLGKHAGELAYSGPGRTMRHYLASVVPHIPVNGNEQYYVIYSTAKPMNPIASYSRIHYSPASGMERWAEEVRFWMDVLLDDPGYAGKFNASLNAYIGSRLPDAEPFQWCREDMPAKEAAIGGQACDGSLFDDPGVHTVIVGSARIIGRDGEVANVTLTETNVVPPLDGIDFDSVESTGRSLGDVDSGISRFLKKLGGEAVAEVFDAAVKKKNPPG